MCTFAWEKRWKRAACSSDVIPNPVSSIENSNDVNIELLILLLLFEVCCWVGEEERVGERTEGEEDNREEDEDE